MRLDKPILCEKPVCKDLVELRGLMDDCRRYGTKLQMVSQYDYLVNHEAFGPSHWDYYRSGPDGLAWDCIQIIASSKERPTLSNRSPIWSCAINGEKLRIEEMDYAYVWMIKDWLAKPRNDIERILRSHESVERWQEGCTA